MTVSRPNGRLDSPLSGPSESERPAGRGSARHEPGLGEGTFATTYSRCIMAGATRRRIEAISASHSRWIEIVAPGSPATGGKVSFPYRNVLTYTGGDGRPHRDRGAFCGFALVAGRALPAFAGSSRKPSDREGRHLSGFQGHGSFTAGNSAGHGGTEGAGNSIAGPHSARRRWAQEDRRSGPVAEDRS